MSVYTFTMTDRASHKRQTLDRQKLDNIRTF